MSAELTIRVLLIGIISLMIALGVSGYVRETGPEPAEEGKQKYGPLYLGSALPLFFLLVFITGPAFFGISSTFKIALSVCFGVSLHICLYYAVLIMVLPFFRKHINARACAVFWLLPNDLYFILWFSGMKISKPLLMIHASKRLVTILFAVWLLGCLAVLSWNITRHLLFRRKILSHSVPVTDSGVLQSFHAALEETAFHNPKLQLVMTDDVSTPLTVGLYQRSTKIVLPRKNYSPDELHLIFRHELIHISRADSWTKFFMMFCTAMCWFNPLMWLAMKKSAEDVELSCDETVLLGADESTRNQYANLILSAAGDDRGFSTCLSATATSMRYRLKTIMKPQKRRTGALAIGFTCFVLYMTCGYVSLVYGEDTGAATIFRGSDPDEFVVYSITTTDGTYIDSMDGIDTEALTRYIADLVTQEMTGDYSYSDEQYFSVDYHSPYGIVFVHLGTEFIKVRYLDDENTGWYVYHLQEPTDWDYIDSIVPPLPEAKADPSKTE